MALRAIRTTGIFYPPKLLIPSLPSDPNFYSNSSRIDPSLPIDQLAHQLVDLFSHPPILGERSEELRHLGHRLTPEMVETILKDLEGWSAAHKFFRWASWQHGFHHNCYTYNTMASILARARQRAQLKALAAEVVSVRCPMTPGALGFLIRCLGNQGLIEEANLVFDRAGDLNCVPNAYTYNCLLEVLSKAGRVEAVDSRFREMVVGKGWEPDKYTLTSVLQSCCNAGKSEEVLKIFDRMNGNGWVDGHVLTVLIVTFCKWGKVARACELIQRMEVLGMMLSEKTFHVLVHGFSRQGRVDRALEMFEKMKGSGFCGDLPLYSVLIEGLCEGKELVRALDLYMDMKDNCTYPDARLVKKMISALCGEGDLVNANKLLEENLEMLNLGSLVSLYNAVLDGLVNHGDVDRAHMLLRAMMKSQSLQSSQVKVDEYICSESGPATETLFQIKKPVYPNADSFNIVICGLCKIQKLDVALVLLNDMIKVGCKGKLLMYNNLISELCNVDRLEESYELLRKMREFGLTPTEFTYNSIFYCLCKRRDLSGSLDLLRDMRCQGHVPWIKHCTLMVQQLCRNGKVAEASGFLDDMVKVGFLPDMVAYSAAIDGMCKIGEIDKALSLFCDISSNCYLPDVVAYNILINGFCKAGRMNAAQETLEEMLEKGLVPSVVTYNLMIDGWCKADRIDNAFACFAKMIDEARPPTVVTYTSLIDGLCNAGRAEDALALWNEMREKECSPNQMSYTALVHGLCKCGDADAALVHYNEMKERDFELETSVYLLLINSLVLKGNSVKAFELLKDALRKESFPSTDSKNFRLMKKAVHKLYKDESTSLDVRILIESGYIPFMKSIHDIGEEITYTV